MVSPGCGYAIPPETTEQAAIRKQCRSVIQKYSWEMIFAKDEAEFYSLLTEMQTEAVNLGYEEIFALDLENAMARENARKEAVEQYEMKNK